MWFNDEKSDPYRSLEFWMLSSIISDNSVTSLMTSSNTSDAQP